MMSDGWGEEERKRKGVLSRSGDREESSPTSHQRRSPQVHRTMQTTPRAERRGDRQQMTTRPMQCFPR